MYKPKENKLSQPEFIPMTGAEARNLGWDEIDILLITGDAYVDHPSFGAAVIARVLIDSGYTVGVVAQPDWKTKESLNVFGRPRIACAVTSGNLDSMLNIYTAARRKRKTDAYSPGGKTGLRPPHAVNVYSNLAKSAFPGTPVIIGGIEAGMRRIAHYDYWKDRILPTVLHTSKADILVYGMGESSLLKIIRKIQNNHSIFDVPGTAVLPGANDSEKIKNSIAKDTYIEIPAFEEIKTRKGSLLKSHLISEKEMNPFNGKKIIQKYRDRILIVNTPAQPLTETELDKIYSLPYSRKPSPFYKEKIPAFEMIKNSITSMRGCPGGCTFCGIGLHQGKYLQSRSRKSILSEVRRLSRMKYFSGTVTDIGGPTANSYKNTSYIKEKCRSCKRPSCLYPEICSNYKIDEQQLIILLKDILKQKKVNHVFINSGIRLDLAQNQPALMKSIVKEHVSGHLKVAPEHLDATVLTLMRKNSCDSFYSFIKFFEKYSKQFRKKQYIVPYFIANFPGSDLNSMKKIDVFLSHSNWSLQQVQDFIPLPMTIASAMYCEGMDQNFNKIKVNRGLKERRPQLEKLKKKRH
ncbi:MAG: YgiQ family radical SAM protein [Victivallales bacterium]|nr:YgiQ family radical SAM protein [Victivallales bacterium]